MSEARGLRDKLEETQAELLRTRAHLEKLRAHQSREQETLRQELDAARHEVTQLRQRLQEAEEREILPRAEAARVESVLVASPGVASTALVALVREPAFTERELTRLSRLLRTSPVDVRMRIMALPPIVVARVPVGEAEALKEALSAEGFLAVIREVPPRAAGGLMTTVRRFTLEAQALELSGTKGERQQVLYSELRLLVRGRRTVVEMESRPIWERDATASAMDPSNHAVRREQHGQFLWVLGERVRVAFSHETTFTGLGEQMGLSRHDSLERLTEELRQRAPQAVFDDRFMRNPRFTLPMVEEERGQEMLAELLDQAIQEGLWS